MSVSVSFVLNVVVQHSTSTVLMCVVLRRNTTKESSILLIGDVAYCMQ